MVYIAATQRPHVCSRRTSGRSAPCNQPFRSQSRRTVVPKATVAPVSDKLEYKPIPTLSGQLPVLGTYGKYPTNVLFLPVEDDFQAQQCRCLDVSVLGIHIYHTRHPKDIAMATKNPEVWQKTSSWTNLYRWLGGGLASEADPAKHLRAREMLAPAFKAQAIKDLVPVFADVGQQLTDIMRNKQGQQLEMEALTRRATLDVIGRAGFGFDFRALEAYAVPGSCKSGIDVVQVFEDITPTATDLFINVWLPEVLVPGYQRYVKAIEKLEVVVQQMLSEYRSDGISADDKSLLSAMLRVQQADPEGFVTDQHIRDQLMTFMFAGSDTTANTLAFCLYEIAQRPEVQIKIQEELQQVLGNTPTDQLKPEVFSQLPYLTGCINEALRLYPAAPSLIRKLSKDQACGEHLFPAESYALMSIFSCHRHPDFWYRPTEFLPERWLPENVKQWGPQLPEAFVPFSSGIRSCIGRYFAMIEMQVILAILLRQVSVKPVSGKEELQLVQKFVLASKDGIWLQASAN